MFKIINFLKNSPIFHLRNRYIPALLIIAVFSTLTVQNLDDIMVSIEEDGEIINISGRQRMLSQKLVLLASEYHENPNENQKEELQKAVKLIESSHNYLLKNTSVELLDEIYYKNKLDNDVKSYIKTLYEILSDNNQFERVVLFKQSQELLLKLDNAVKKYELYSKTKLEHLSKKSQEIFLYMLLIILLEAYFIFYPASKKIKENTKELSSQKKYLDVVIDSSKSAIISIDEDLKVKTFNKAAENMFGYSAKEMLDENMLNKIVPIQYLDAHTKAVNNYMKKGISTGAINQSHELKAQHRNGNIFPIRISFGVDLINNQKTVVANIIDISNEIRYRDELKELNEMLEEKVRIKTNELQKYLNIVNQHILISTTDLNGVITYANEAFCDLSGYTREELEGQHHNIIRHKDMPKSAFKEMWKTIKSGNTWRGKVKNLKKNGDYYWVDAVVSPNYNDDNIIDSYNAVRIDITDKINLEKMTKHQSEIIKERTEIAIIERDKAKAYAKAKGEFLANMSHEIRTPLNAILGFIDILKDEEMSEKSMKYIDIIDKSSLSLLNIIEDILDFSKIESGKLNIDKIYFNPYEEFKVILDLHSAQCIKKNINLSVTIDKLFPKYIKTDLLRVKQVISNLLSNAIKFTSEDKNIFVTISFDAERLNVSVKDEGKGIAKDKLEHIFEAFNQEDNSTTREYGGTGLGLAISSELVRLLGGKLEVKSELNKGSEFYFNIPVEKSSTKQDDVIQDIEYTFRDDTKILLVEDNLPNQMLMKIIFKKMNILFDIANDGLEAVDMYQNNKYDLILMDENMPNLNGIEATKRIIEYEKENNLSHTPIVALTANTIKGDRERFLEAGMDEYLSKPINKKKLAYMLSLFIK